MNRIRIGAAELQARFDRLEATVGCEDEPGWLIRARPGRPAGHVHPGGQPAGACVGLHMEANRHHLHPVARWRHVIGPLTDGPAAAQDGHVVRPRRVALEMARGEIERGGHGIVHHASLGKAHEIVHLPAPPEQERMAHRAVVDEPTAVVVGDREPALAARQAVGIVHLERPVAATRLDQPLRLDAARHARPTPRDEHAIATRRGIDLLHHAAGDGVANDAPEHRNVDAVIRGTGGAGSSTDGHPRGESPGTQAEEQGTAGEEKSARHGRHCTGKRR